MARRYGRGFYQVGTGSSLTWGPGQVSSTKTIDLKVVVSAGGESNSVQRQVNVFDSGFKLTTPPTSTQPDTLRIGEVAPTPARTRARLNVTLPQLREVRVTVYNTLGHSVRQSRTMLSAGRHEVPIGVTGLSSGMYFARITVGPVTRTRRIMVVR